ncbi:MAG TPA: ABC transporter substrate-binding protein [Burkholderiales bacterium]|jgi:NitT/TauT family transport system substrate-binding protein|nr:ABC transporter substrate-binding protein [Burkholderiales bacterium]
MRVLKTVVAAGAALLVATAAQAQPKAKFILDWAFQGQQSTWTLAQDKGYFKAAGADITVDRGYGSGDTIAKVASGAWDIGLADLYVLLRFLGENPDQKLKAFFLHYDRSALSVASLKESGIVKPADLKGKTIAAPQGDASFQVFPLFAKRNGLDPQSINWKTVTPDLRETMLLRKQADAVTGHILTVRLNLMSAKIDLSQVHFMPYADYGVDLYGHVLVAKADWLEKNPAIARAMIIGTVKGFNDMIADPAAAVASVSKRDPLIKPDIERERLLFTVKSVHDTPAVRKDGIGVVNKERLSRTLAQVSEAFNMKRSVSADEIFTDKFYPPKSELKVNIK